MTPPLKFPRPEDVAKYIAAIDPKEDFASVTLLANLLSFQANTIYTLGDFLIVEARKFELTHKTITPEALKAAAEKLINYAATLAPRRQELSLNNVEEGQEQNR